MISAASKSLILCLTHFRMFNFMPHYSAYFHEHRANRISFGFVRIHNVPVDKVEERINQTKGATGVNPSRVTAIIF